jgi:hypothetical protein
MKRIYNKFKGYTLADCDCKYCLYYGGKRKGKIICLADECVCAYEIRGPKSIKWTRKIRKN